MQASLLFNAAAAAVQAAQACDVTDDAGLKAAARRYQVGCLSSIKHSLQKLDDVKESSNDSMSVCAAQPHQGAVL